MQQLHPVLIVEVEESVDVSEEGDPEVVVNEVKQESLAALLILTFPQNRKEADINGKVADKEDQHLGEYV